MKCTRPVLERCKTGPIEVIERPCGKCPACLSNKAQDWVYRLYAEQKLHDKAVFVTLTYDDEHLQHLQLSQSGLYSLSKVDSQKFMKRLRKAVEPRKVRFFLAGEYGENTKRAHFHAIIYGLDVEDRQVIDQAWSNGFVKVGTVTPASLAYTARYCVKKLFNDGAAYKELGLEPEFCLMSRNPGIGANALHKGLKRSDDGHYYVWFKGQRQRAPRYFVDKVRTAVEQLVARRSSIDARDERTRSYEDSGKSEVEEQLQAEKNALASRRARARV